MNEKILENKKHGMRMLLFTLCIYAADIAALVYAAISREKQVTTAGTVLLVISILVFLLDGICYGG